MKTVITVLIFSWCHAAIGQQVMGLHEILRTIDSAHPTAHMYDAEIRSLDAAAKGAGNWMPTEFGTGLWMTPYNPGMWKKGDNGTADMGQYMLSVQQMIPNIKRQRAEAAYLEGMSAPEKDRKNFVLNELHAIARKNYYDWIIMKKRLVLLDENEQLLNFMLSNAEIRYKNGLDKLNTYYKAKAELRNIMNMKEGLNNEINQARIRLNTLMNRNRLEPFVIDSVYNIPNNAELVDTVKLNAKSNIRAIDQDIRLSELQQKAEKAKEFPEYGLRYDHMFGFGGLPMQYSLMGMIKIPIGRANRASKASVESLKWKAEALSQQKQMLINEASGSISGIIYDIASRKIQVKLFEENIIPALKKNYELIQLGYQQNTEPLSILLDAWETLSKTQSEYLNLLQQLLNLQVELERILEVK